MTWIYNIRYGIFGKVVGFRVYNGIATTNTEGYATVYFQKPLRRIRPVHIFSSYDDIIFNILEITREYFVVRSYKVLISTAGAHIHDSDYSGLHTHASSISTLPAHSHVSTTANEGSHSHPVSTATVGFATVIRAITVYYDTVFECVPPYREFQAASCNYTTFVSIGDHAHYIGPVSHEHTLYISTTDHVHTITALSTGEHTHTIYPSGAHTHTISLSPTSAIFYWYALDK